MNKESELYVQQMKHWFDEHERIGQQIERAITNYEELAQSNREQLKLHNERTELVRNEFNIWLKEHQDIAE